jgi:hypothetical protein
MHCCSTRFRDFYVQHGDYEWDPQNGANVTVSGTYAMLALTLMAALPFWVVISTTGAAFLVGLAYAELESACKCDHSKYVKAPLTVAICIGAAAAGVFALAEWNTHGEPLRRCTASFTYCPSLDYSSQCSNIAADWTSNSTCQSKFDELLSWKANSCWSGDDFTRLMSPVQSEVFLAGCSWAVVYVSASYLEVLWFNRELSLTRSATLALLFYAFAAGPPFVANIFIGAGTRTIGIEDAVFLFVLLFFPFVGWLFHHSLRMLDVDAADDVEQHSARLLPDGQINVVAANLQEQHATLRSQRLGAAAGATVMLGISSIPAFYHKNGLASLPLAVRMWNAMFGLLAGAACGALTQLIWKLLVEMAQKA